jgi:catechol 2,3-dioxygenase-like lactoylglutathione lyase family enzyme
VPVTGIDHVYAETQEWESSVAFWHSLGFAFVDSWGSEGHRAGRLESNGAAVVLAEVGQDATPAFNVFFDLQDADGYEPGPSARVVTPLEATHWNTRWIRVLDPEGRVHCLEET